MDYPGRMRLKIWGRARFVEGNAELLAKVEDPEYGAKVERVFVFTVDVMDGNCSQHIQPRFTEEQVEDRVTDLKQQIKNCCPE